MRDSTYPSIMILANGETYQVILHLKSSLTRSIQLTETNVVVIVISVMDIVVDKLHCCCVDFFFYFYCFHLYQDFSSVKI